MAMNSDELYSWIINNWTNKANYRESTSDPSDTPSNKFVLHNNVSTKTIWCWNGFLWSKGIGGGGINPQVVTTNFKASIGSLYLCDVSNNSITVDMSNFVTKNITTSLYESNLNAGDYFEVYIIKGDSTINTVTLSFTGLQASPYNYTLKLEGQSGSDFIFDSNGYFRFTYSGDPSIGFKINSMTGAVPKDSGVIGSLLAFSGFTPPTGYFFADGSSKSRVDYEALFNVLTFSITGTLTTGTKNITTSSTANLYVGEKIEGTGIPIGTTISSITDGTTFVISNNATITGSTSILVLPYGSLTSTTFKIPNTKGRVLTTPDASTEFKAVGATGGEKSHVLSISEMPSHNHGYRTANGTEYCSNAWNTDESCCDEPWGDFTTGNTGGNQAHNNLQPYLCCNYIIKY